MNHTPTDQVPFLCCALNGVRSCSACGRSICKVHMRSQHLCIQCGNWLLNISWK